MAVWLARSARLKINAVSHLVQPVLQDNMQLSAHPSASTVPLASEMTTAAQRHRASAVSMVSMLQLRLQCAPTAWPATLTWILTHRQHARCVY